MIKDREKHQPVPESATLMLQLLSKEKSKEVEKKESAAETAKVRCKVCFMEIAPKRLCSGHGSGSGGGDSASSDKTTEEKASPGELVKTTELTGKFDSIEDSEALLEEESFTPEIIAKLVAKGLLLVDSSRESKTITIKLHCGPNLLTKEQEEEVTKFMETITKEFNEFKEKNNLSDDCIEILKDEKGNILSLRITLPTLALYDAFIHQLANNLVPMHGMKEQERDEVTEERSFAPNPLSMKPNPANKSSKQEKIERNMYVEPKKTEKEEEKQVFNPSPFNMKPLIK